MIRGLIAIAMLIPACASAAEPAVVQPGWSMTLFAAQPQIVTPVGIAAHPDGGVLVVESHTHSPNEGYRGPDSDLLVWLRDVDGDGGADRRVVVADDLEDAMNVVVASDGAIYLVQRNKVIRFEDDDGDGVADRRDTLLWLETEQTYDHSCLLGIALTPTGDLLVSRGNLGGHAYTYRSAAGERIEGYGEGGDIVQLATDGSGLRRFATGFWNPFALAADSNRVLWAVDNDPDAVGPNRLLHLVEDGDYGFRALYGASGRWPLSSWNGELPGTLPWAAATGEAPSGIAPVSSSSGNCDDLLVSVWGEHRIDLYRPTIEEGRLRATRVPLIEGPEDFRPVAIVAATPHEFYVTDWVRKDYPNHGQGRVWRLVRSTNAPGHDEGQNRIADDQVEQLVEELASLRAAGLPLAGKHLNTAFHLTVAVDGLSQSSWDDLQQAARAVDPGVRLAALLAMETVADDGERDAAWWRWALRDDDLQIRIAALAVAAEHGSTEHRDMLRDALALGPVDDQLVAVYLAADEALSLEAQQRRRDARPSMGHDREFQPETVARLLRQSALPDAALARLLAAAETALGQDAQPAALRLIDHPDPAVRREAVWTLARAGADDAVAKLRSLIDDRQADALVRADAIALLATKLSTQSLVKLLGSTHDQIAYEALRALSSPSHRSETELLRSALQQLHTRPALQEHVRALFPELTSGAIAPQPESFAEWLERTADGGDAAAGRRVFFSEKAQCSACHRAEGRGGTVGPELTEVGKGHDAASLLRSMLDPSQEISPEYQSHTLVTIDGEIISGIQFHYRSGGSAVSIIPQDGRERRFQLEELETYRTDSKSLMPDNLVENLTVKEVRDLVAYLMAR